MHHVELILRKLLIWISCNTPYRELLLYHCIIIYTKCDFKVIIELEDKYGTVSQRPLYCSNVNLFDDCYIVLELQNNCQQL